MLPAMTEEHLNALLAAGEAKKDDQGSMRPAQGRTWTLYVVSGSASLTVSKVDSLRVEKELLHARTSKGELFILSLKDVYAGAIDTASGYILDSANYHDLLILNGGIRYDDYNIHTSGYGTGGLSSVFGQQAAEFGMPNFNLGLTLKPRPNGSVYVAYATSSNPVGAEFDGTSTAYGGLANVVAGNANQIFGPEQNKAIELGTKWELFDRHLLLTAALFQTTKDNAREAFNVTSTANQTASCPYIGTTVSCIIAGASYYVRGLDLGVGGKITDKWSVFGGLVLMQSQVTQSNVPHANIPQPLLYTSNVGLPLANVAHQSFSMLSKYQLNDTWELGGQAVYRSKIYGGTLLAANQGTSIPSYWRFDAFAEAKVDKHWTVKLFVNNIFDKRYYDALYQSALPFALEAPDGSAWEFGDPSAAATVVTGTALDLCTVAGQRALASHTSLDASGPDAAQVLATVRTFA